MTRLRQEFQTVRSEGGLLPPDLLRRLLDRHSSLVGTRPEDYGLSPGERVNEVITHSWNRLRRHYGEFRAAAANLPDGEAGTARLRHLAGRIKGSRHGDLWRQFRLLADALRGESDFESARRRLALPALGSFLWSRDSTPELNRAELNNHDFLEAPRHLAFTRQNKVLRPVDYRNLGAEELGGVYEGLLALTPQVSGDGADCTFAEFPGNARKTSGSYYTPDSLVQCLLDSALDPVVEEAVRGKSGADAERAILDLKVCDPAVGSGHFLVGAAHRLARHLARVRAHAAGESEPSPLLYQHALRDVIGRCLYGVDMNPMAAELCRVSLWLEALEPGKPLSFLDHHIRVGNGLLGTTPALIEAGLPDEAFKPQQGDDRKICTGLRRRNKAERESGQRDMGYLMVAEPSAEYDTLASRSRWIDESPDDTLGEVRGKEAQFRRLVVSGEYRHRQLVADAWCAAFVQPKGAGMDPALCITTETLRGLEAAPRPWRPRSAGRSSGSRGTTSSFTGIWRFRRCSRAGMGAAWYCAIRGSHSADVGIQMSVFPKSECTATGQSRYAACHSSKEPSHPVERIRIFTRGSGSSNVEFHQAFVVGQATGLGSSDSESDHLTHVINGTPGESDLNGHQRVVALIRHGLQIA